MVICLERGADLHAVLMPLLLTVSCFSKIQRVPAHPCTPGKRADKQVLLLSLVYFNTGRQKQWRSQEAFAAVTPRTGQGQEIIVGSVVHAAGLN